MKVEIRPFTSEERAILAGLASPLKFSFIEWSGLLLLSTFAIWGLAYRGLIALFPSFQSAGLIFHVFVFFAVFLCAWRYRARRLRRSLNSEFLQELNEGNAETCVIQVREAVQVEEFEDEGPGFYLESDAGKALFLQGQYLYDLKDFPSTRIKIVRAPRSRTVLDLKCLGSPLTVSSKLPSFTPQDHESGRAHYDGDVIDQNIDEITRRK